ncbi:MAG: RluA family pseudouridine synthase [Parvularculaceae bacterium]|nr:RluA family pseudouridine synthase [Parvularculaceae bacterium]
MSSVQTIVVADRDDGLRLDRWFKTHFPALNHGALEKLLRTGQVRVNGGRVKANRRVEAGESIRVPPISAAPTAEPPAAAPRKGDADLIRKMTIFEDDHLLALNKPFGLAVQGGTKTKTHIDGMLAALERDGERPRLVHRLDADTGGLLIVAKTRKAAAALSKAFQGRGVEKTYWGIVVGSPPHREGTINLSIAKKMIWAEDGQSERMTAADDDEAKTAITDYMTLDKTGPVTFLALKPVTGRTHQLRVHCAAMGAPIVGDRKYGGPRARIEGAGEGLHLFCRSMTFPHPATGKPTTITAPLTGLMKASFSLFEFNENAKVTWPDLPWKKNAK